MNHFAILRSADAPSHLSSDELAAYTQRTNPTITNLPFKADGSLNNINGFGTVNGARDPRIMQLVARFRF